MSRRPSAIKRNFNTPSLSPLAKPCDHLGGGLHLTRFDLAAAQGEDLEQRNGLLHPLVAVDVLYDRLGFAILSDDQGLLLVPERAHDLGSVGFEVTDRFLSDWTAS